MSGFKGTPGPWRAVDKRPYSDGFSIFSGNQYVAFVGDSDGVTDYLSNANLIAAAPELLAVLIELLDIEGPQPGHVDWARKAKSVVAKALGQ